jgi:hypothetical protein
MKKIIWKLLGLIFLVIILLKIDWQGTKEILKRVSFLFIILASFFELFRLFIESLRWKLLIRLQKLSYSVKNSFLVILASTYCGIVTPGRVGNFIRAFYLSKDKSIPLGLSFSNVIADQLMELFTIVCFGLWGLNILKSHFQIFAIIFLSLIFLIFLFSVVKSRNLQEKLVTLILRKRKKILLEAKDGIKYFQQGLKFFYSYKILIPFLVSLFSFSILFFHGFIIAKALMINIGFVNLAKAIALTRLISRVIPISFSGWGSKDISLILIFNSWGLDKSVGIAFSLIFLFTSYLISTIFGFFAWNYKPLVS